MINTNRWHLLLKSESQTANSFSIDSEQRVDWNSSIWQKITHFFSKRKLDKAVELHLKSFFQERHQIDSHDINQVWDRLGATVWTPNKELTVGVLRAIDAKFHECVSFYGKGIHAIDTADPSSMSMTQQKVHTLMGALLHGHKFSLKTLWGDTFKSIFIQRDPAFMEDFKKELQAEITYLSENVPSDPHDLFLWKSYLGNVISYIPFCYPKKGDTFVIPVIKDGQKVDVTYGVDVIELPYSDFSSPMHAIGLRPTSDTTAPPLLSFMGTTYPAGEGFIATLLADFTPGKAVGEPIYKDVDNHKKIDTWINDNEGAQVFGMSLGGALALQTFKEYHNKLSEVHVYNPPGLLDGAWDRPFDSGAKLNIYCQTNDIVSQLGYWPTGKNVSLFRVMTRQKANMLRSHACSFAGFKQVTVLKTNPEEENGSWLRKAITKSYYWFGPLAVFVPVGLLLLTYAATKKVKALAKRMFGKK